eukprot:10778744-Alexandrium_andersonii.AAC.1
MPGFNLRVPKFCILHKRIRDHHIHRLMKIVTAEHSAGRAVLFHCFGGVHRSPHGAAVPCLARWVGRDGAPIWGEP